VFVEVLQIHISAGASGGDQIDGQQALKVDKLQPPGDAAEGMLSALASVRSLLRHIINGNLGLLSPLSTGLLGSGRVCC